MRGMSRDWLLLLIWKWDSLLWNEATSYTFESSKLLTIDMALDIALDVTRRRLFTWSLLLELTADGMSTRDVVLWFNL